jgi:hypothetical protein
MAADPRPGDTIDLGLGYVAVWTRGAGELRPVIIDRRRHGFTDVHVLAALEDIALPGGVPCSLWERAAAVSPRTFYRARARLLAQGLVLNLGTERQPRYTPAVDPFANGAGRPTHPAPSSATTVTSTDQVTADGT